MVERFQGTEGNDDSLTTFQNALDEVQNLRLSETISTTNSAEEPDYLTVSNPWNDQQSQESTTSAVISDVQESDPTAETSADGTSDVAEDVPQETETGDVDADPQQAETDESSEAIGPEPKWGSRILVAEKENVEPDGSKSITRFDQVEGEVLKGVTYNQDGKVIRETDYENGRPTDSVEYDGDGNIVRQNSYEYNADGSCVCTTTDGSGNVISKTSLDAQGKHTQIQYYENGALKYTDNYGTGENHGTVERTHADGSVDRFTFQYGSDNKITGLECTLSDGSIERHEYDENGRETKIEAEYPQGRKVTWNLNEQGVTQVVTVDTSTGIVQKDVMDPVTGERTSSVGYKIENGVPVENPDHTAIETPRPQFCSRQEEARRYRALMNGESADMTGIAPSLTTDRLPPSTTDSEIAQRDTPAQLTPAETESLVSLIATLSAKYPRYSPNRGIDGRSMAAIA